MLALGFKEHGDISKMQILDLEIPKPKPNEVLVKVKASAFNHLDIWVRIGWPGLKLTMPHISGSDAAGEIVETGQNVKHLKPGDRVALNPGFNDVVDIHTLRGQHSVSPHFKILGEQVPGTHTEYITVTAENCIILQDDIDFQTAAAAGLVSLTAWRMLIERAKIRAGENVLIIGAGGGVNSIAIQIAKFAGCKVFALTSTQEKIDLAYKIGADVVINYKKEPDWPEKIFELTHKQGVDVVVDNVGHATLQNSLRVVKRGGRIVIVGNTSGAHVQIDLRYLYAKQISIIGSTMGSPQDYHEVMQLVFQKKIIPIIYKSLPLTEGIEAMKILEEGEQFGKIVLRS